MDVHNNMERKGRRSVPQFGAWDQKTGGEECTNYTVVFSQARADRKQNKSEVPIARYSLGNDNELHHNTTNTHKQQHHHHHYHPYHNTTADDATVKRRKGFLSYFSCFSG